MLQELPHWQLRTGFSQGALKGMLVKVRGSKDEVAPDLEDDTVKFLGWQLPTLQHFSTCNT